MRPRKPALTVGDLAALPLNRFVQSNAYRILRAYNQLYIRVDGFSPDMLLISCLRCKLNMTGKSMTDNPEYLRHKSQYTRV
jgi:hypothetical protein